MTLLAVDRLTCPVPVRPVPEGVEFTQEVTGIVAGLQGQGGNVVMVHFCNG